MGVVVLAFVVIFLIGSLAVSCLGGEDDCYTTGEPGSAQEQRDIERCLE
jgi:hypothetical protein